MRTTVTIDPDNQAVIEQVMKEQGRTFKEVLNDLIARGASADRQPRVVRTPVRSMGRARLDLTKALQIAGELEDQEIVRKMMLGK